MKTRFKQALIIEVDDFDTYELFGLDDSEPFAITKESLDGFEEWLVDRNCDEGLECDSIEEFNQIKEEVVPKEDLDFLNLIKEKLETYEEVQVRYSKIGE